eukprot:m.95244 g.95244  ORF g.95244 m.95244 type:complete len:72 (+) comp14759_c0_seq1:573-788(+)
MGAHVAAVTKMQSNMHFVTVSQGLVIANVIVFPATHAPHLTLAWEVVVMLDVVIVTVIVAVVTVIAHVNTI